MAIFCRYSVAFCTGLCCVLAGTCTRAAQTRSGEWPVYAGDNASTKYSPLDQINKRNVDQLEIAWIWKSVEYELAEEKRILRPTSIFESTPLMIDGVLYLSTPLYQAAAVDARTGQTLWVYDPKAY